MTDNTLWKDLDPHDIRRQVAYVASHSSDGFSWPTYEKFIEVMELPDSSLAKTYYYECQHVHTMYTGKWAGWWELSWDMFPDSDERYPIKLVVVSLALTEHTHFASLLAEIGIFKSTSEAKKNGWSKLLTAGDFLFKKKTYILRLRND